MLRFICAAMVIPLWIWSIDITLGWCGATLTDPAPYPAPYVIGSWLATWVVTKVALKD